MIWGNFLHFYQPAEQKKEVLDAIVSQCYRPIFSKLKILPGVKITVNISSCLLELLDEHGYLDVIEDIKECVKLGKIELVGSAKYHALLPLLNAEEIKRQIVSNEETLRKYFGKDLHLSGFFPPEMAVNTTVLKVLKQISYKWVILDEISLGVNLSHINTQVIFKDKLTGLAILPRSRRLSNLLMSGVVRDSKTFTESLGEDLNSSSYLVSAMDGETFGHHRPGLEDLLFQLVSGKHTYQSLLLSEILDKYKSVKYIEAKPSTWASSAEDISNGVQFASWKDPTNPIHKLQHKLTKLVTNEFYKSKRKGNPRIRRDFDLALASDHYWWASAKPWWSVEMIELGAYRLLKVLEALGSSKKMLAEANNIYSQIVKLAFSWQREDRVSRYQRESDRVRIPFKDRTIGRGGAEEGVYHAFISMMSELETKFAKKGQYEMAILWRDAIYKLDKRLDIFETMNAVDLVRVHIPNADVEKIIEKYKEKFRKIRSGQVEQRD